MSPFIVDESGRLLGGYAGPERRTGAGVVPAGGDRRNAPLVGSVADRAAAMRAENPNIDKDAAAMRARAQAGAR